MVKQIIKEAMDRNPIGLKEALQEELKARVALALESKMEEELDESASKYRVDTGPLMKANAWIKSAPLSKMAEELHKKGESGNFAIGHLNKPGDTTSSKKSQIAISIGNSNPDYYFEKGMNKEHSFYYDTGRGHRQTQETITITGMITIDKEGNVKPSGKVNMNARTSLMVFK
jgi:hypothetical protein